MLLVVLGEFVLDLLQGAGDVHAPLVHQLIEVVARDPARDAGVPVGRLLGVLLAQGVQRGVDLARPSAGEDLAELVR